MGYPCEQINLNNGKWFKISGEMTGKMEGIKSLNTSHMLNANCQKNRNDENSVCSSCYSYVSEKRFTRVGKLYQHNYKILSTHALKNNEVPILEQNTLFRFNAHGDLINRVHYNNLIKIAKFNPGVHFALWTKNLKVINNGNGIIKMDNIQYIYSDMYLNNLNNPIVPYGFNKIFRVYNTKAIRENKSIVINCSNNCYKCRLCYTPNDIQIINEQIKSRFR